MRLLYYCALAQQNGYARAAEDYCLALHCAGVNIAVRPLYDCNLDNLEDGYEALGELARRKLDDPTHVVIHAMPQAAVDFAVTSPILQNDAQAICVTTWETDRLSIKLREKLAEHFDQVIVPSKFCKVAIGPGVFSNIVPHCANEGFWRPLSDRDDDAPYVFYTIGANTPRKNIEGVLRCYLTRFGQEDDVLLVIVSQDRISLEQTIERIKTADGTGDYAPVQIVDRRLSNEDLRAVHDRADCYVSTSRGEGWNLGAFEATLMGKVIIAPTFGGQADYLSYAAWHKVGGNLTPALAMSETVVKTLGIGDARIPMAAQTQRKPTGVDGRQLWLEPDLFATSNHMRSAYDGRHQGLGDRNGKELRARYGYAAIGPLFRRLLEAP